MSAAKWRYGRKIRSSGLIADAWNDTVDILSGTTALLGLGITLLDPDKIRRGRPYRRLRRRHHRHLRRHPRGPRHRRCNSWTPCPTRKPWTASA